MIGCSMRSFPAVTVNVTVTVTVLLALLVATTVVELSQAFTLFTTHTQTHAHNIGCPGCNCNSRQGFTLPTGNNSPQQLLQPPRETNAVVLSAQKKRRRRRKDSPSSSSSQPVSDVGREDVEVDVDVQSESESSSASEQDVPLSSSNSNSKNELPDFDLGGEDGEDEAAAAAAARKRKINPNEITANMMGSKNYNNNNSGGGGGGAQRSLDELISDRALESKLEFDDEEVDPNIPDFIDLAKASSTTPIGDGSSVVGEIGKKKQRRAERVANAIAAKEAEESEKSFLYNIPQILNEKGEVSAIKILEQGAWTGIFLLIGWEVYINSPLFERAAPMAPIVYELLM